MQLKYDLRGGRELSQVLKKLPGNMRKRVLVNAARASAKEMKDEAIRLAPRSNINRQAKYSKKKKFYQKHLHEQIKVSTLNRGRWHAKVTVHIGNAFWGRMQEFGTKNHSARPWFRPSWDKSKTPMLNTLRKRLMTGINRETKKLVKPFSKKLLK